MEEQRQRDQTAVKARTEHKLSSIHFISMFVVSFVLSYCLFPLLSLFQLLSLRSAYDRVVREADSSAEQLRQTQQGKQQRK